MRSFRGAAPGTTLTVTIALTILLIGVAQYLFQANGQQRTPDYLFGDRSVTIAGARIRWDEVAFLVLAVAVRSEEHTSELQSLMRISYAVFCLKKKKLTNTT